MNVAPRVGRAEQQGGDPAERGDERADERDRAAHSHQDRLRAETLPERVLRRDERRAVGLGVPRRGAAVVDDLELETPGKPAFEMRAQLPDDAGGLLSRGQPQAHARGRRGDDLVRRTGNRMRVEADHRERRAHPKPLER